jgi:hypothetical protein
MAFVPVRYRFAFFFGAGFDFLEGALAAFVAVFFDAAPLLAAFFLPPNADVQPSEYFCVVPTRIIVTVVPFSELNRSKAENARPDAARLRNLLLPNASFRSRDP